MSRQSNRILAVSVVLAVAVAAAAFGSERSERAGGPFIASSGKARAEVWAVGDGADGSPGSYSVAKMIAGTEPDRFLYLGDVYPNGTAADFAERYRPSYGRLNAITAPTIGNHESANRAVGYDPYWRAVHGRTPPSYYAFRIAGWKIISLDSQIDHSPGSPQVHWLRHKVRGPGNCRIAFWHRPRFNAGTRPGDSGLATFWDALQGNARLVLNGHEHNMQRLAPIQGIVQLIAGSGGDGPYGINRGYPGLRFGNDSDLGAIRLRLRSHRVRYAFVDVEDRVLDSGSLRCRRRS